MLTNNTTQVSSYSFSSFLAIFGTDYKEAFKITSGFAKNIITAHA